MSGYSLTRPLDALDAQIKLLRFIRSEYGARLISGFMKVIYEKTGERVDDLGVPPEDVDKFCDRVPGLMVESLDAAETYTVAPYIANRLWSMAHGFDAQPLLPQDLPTPAGFVILDEPLFIYDVHNKIMTIKAILWSQVGIPAPVRPFERRDPDLITDDRLIPGVALFFFADRDHELDEISRELEATEGPEWVRHVEHKLALCHYQALTYGSIPPHHRGVDSWSDEYSPVAQADILRLFGWLEVFWDFVQDQIPARMSPDRPLRRRMVRAGFGLRDVNVVQLRVEENNWKPPEDHVPQVVAWTHRWRSRRHTRRQWYGSGDNRYQKVIEVAGSIKGPEWLPLIEKDTVFQVRR